MSTEETRSLAELQTDFIRRVVTYTDEITYFGQNSAAYGLALATAQQTAQTEAQRRGVVRRHTLLGATGDALTEIAEEAGTARQGGSRSSTLVILRPWVATVTAITAPNRVEIDDSSHFEAGDSIRIVNADGSLTEIVTVDSVSTGTGPNGGDELVTTAILNSYDPDDETTSVLLRETVLAGTVLTSDPGISFETLDDVTVGDSNPVLLGESDSLSLADKVWVEATTTGEDGNVDAGAINGFQTANDKIRSVSNPVRAQKGTNAESDFELKYRAAHIPQIAAQETAAQLETLCKVGHRDVLRAFVEASDAISTIRLRVLTRAGAGLSADARVALGRFCSARMRSTYAVEIFNVDATAVEVEADITLTPGQGTPQQKVERVWRKVADRLANYLDWRKWPENRAVDEAQLLSIVRQTPGVASLQTSSFLPAEDIEIAAASVPMLVRVAVRDITSGATFGAYLSTSYGV